MPEGPPASPSTLHRARTAARLLLVDPDVLQRRWMAQVVRPIAGEPEGRDRLGTLPPDGDYDLICVDLDVLDEPQRRAFAHERQALEHTQVLHLSSARSAGSFAELFATPGVSHLLAKNPELDAEALLVTVEKILCRDIFGVEKYFDRGTKPAALTLTGSHQKEEALEFARCYAQDAGVLPRLASQLIAVTDELITNALFNAPRRPDGTPTFAHLPRTEHVTLDPGQSVELKLCRDGRTLGVSVSDPFGSLSPARMTDYLSKCFRKGPDQVDPKKGGAGLGFYYIFQALSHFVVNLSPLRRTEMIGLIDVRGTYRDFAARAKSFNVFTDA